MQFERTRESWQIHKARWQFHALCQHHYGQYRCMNAVGLVKAHVVCEAFPVFTLISF